MTSKMGSHTIPIPSTLALPITPLRIMVPVAIPRPENNNSKAATTNAIAKAVLVVPSMI